MAHAPVPQARATTRASDAHALDDDGLLGRSVLWQCLVACDAVTTALVTGANRGIGHEVCRQLASAGHRVLLAARNSERGEAAVARLRASGWDVRFVPLDVASPASVEALPRLLDSMLGGAALDVLVNNAAVHYDTQQSAATADMTIVEEAFATNVLGAWRVTLALLPLLRLSRSARIVNVSSGAGSMAEQGVGTPAYSLTKLALNGLTRQLAAELRHERILVNAVCPGWVATDMGGAGGRPVSQGASGVVWATTLPDDGPTGGFFRDGRPIDW
jgi:NAD(P)-dependent dehydrogenase (short-subunit alcohol dehydrogenase family)